MPNDQTIQLDLGGYEDLRGAIVAHDATEMLLGGSNINNPIEPDMSHEDYKAFLHATCCRIVWDIKRARFQGLVPIVAPDGSYMEQEEYRGLVEVLMGLETDEKERVSN